MFLNCFIATKNALSLTSTCLPFCLYLHMCFSSTCRVELYTNTLSRVFTNAIWYFYSANSSYQVPTYMCLCLITQRLVCTDVAIVAWCFKLNCTYAHSPGSLLLHAGVTTSTLCVSTVKIT